MEALYGTTGDGAGRYIDTSTVFAEATTAAGSLPGEATAAQA